METPVEYFYGETVRCSFGFDNPNKAAVLFACGLPLLWCCWIAAWRIQNRLLRAMGLVVTSAAILASTYSLCMTFSRGGLVAAGVALLYLIARDWFMEKKRSWCKWVLTGLLLTAMFGCVLWTGLGQRSAAAASGDASVGNRMELWTSALQMSVENPLGFGAGNSGEQYMQWYQPIERTQGYRTMVNSYLTFLVEQGWLWSGAVMLAFFLFWVWTKPSGQGYFAAALWASIIGFMVAGLFSTTMEEWRLWIFPIACGLGLVVLAIYQRRHLQIKRYLLVAVVMLIGCLVLVSVGFRESGKDALKREFGMINGSRTVIGLGPKTKTIGVMGCEVDPLVLGEQPSKLLRELALKAGVEIRFAERGKSSDWALWMGQVVNAPASVHPENLILLAPAKMEPGELADLLNKSKQVHILLPEIDEDGRAGFWEDALEGKDPQRFRKTTLSGVGNRVDWAWDQVIEIVKTVAASEYGSITN